MSGELVVRSNGAPAASGQPGSGGASSVEVYGFVGWITSAVGFVIFLVWAFLPEQQLSSLGVTYYPDKHWALTIPLWITLLYVNINWAYESINMTTVPQPSSLYTLYDEKSKWCESVGIDSVVQSTECSIPPLVHVPAPVVSRVLYGRQPVQVAEALERAWLGAAHQQQPPTWIRRPGSKAALGALAAAAAAAEASAAGVAGGSGAAGAADSQAPRWAPAASQQPSTSQPAASDGGSGAANGVADGIRSKRAAGTAAPEHLQAAPDADAAAAAAEPQAHSPGSTEPHAHSPGSAEPHAHSPGSAEPQAHSPGSAESPQSAMTRLRSLRQRLRRKA